MARTDWRRLLPLALAVAYAAAPRAQDAPTLDASADSAMAAYAVAGSPGGVVAVVRGGEVVFAKGYGLAHLEHGAAITPATVFNIGSVAKQFTAFAVAVLVERGDLSLDADVRDYVPELALDRPIRVRHLVHHTSGLRDYFGLLSLAGARDGDLVTQDVVRDLVLSQRELNFGAGAEFGYSNSNYFLLAEIVERVTGETFREWMEANVFGPLGMDQTFVYNDHREVVPGRAASYASTGDGYANADYPLSNYGDGGLYSTAGDLARWLRNFGTHEVGGPAVARRMLERGVLASGDTLDYAFALNVDEHGGLRRVQHSGADAGYRSFLAYYPEIGAGVVALGNVASFDSRGAAERVAEAAFAAEMDASDGPSGEAERIPEPAALPNPEAYVGAYYSAALGMTLYVERDSISHTIHSDFAPPVELRALSDTLFRDMGFGVNLRFDLGPDGQATGGAVLLGGGLPFVRREAGPPELEVLAGYVGRYVSPELGTAYDVRVDGDSLVVSHPSQDDNPLTFIRGDTYASRPLGTLRFERSATGPVTGFRVSRGRVQGVLFEKDE